MKRCILCGKADVELTEEHIIPFALGNASLKAHCLCKDCNSKLGSSVDDKFVNSFDLKAARLNYGINGRNGVPNPFAKATDDDGHLINVDADSNPTLVPYTEHSNGSVKLHASNKEQAKEMAKKIMERKGFSEEKITELLAKIDNMQPQTEERAMNYEVSINLVDRFIAILKIAYEYSCLKLDESYYDDNRAKEIREILTAAIDESIDNDIQNKIGVNFYQGDISDLENIKKNGLFHLLMFSQTEENCLVLFVSLFCEPFYSFIVHISDNAQKYSYQTDPELVLVRHQE